MSWFQTSLQAVWFFQGSVIWIGMWEQELWRAGAKEIFRKGVWKMEKEQREMEAVSLVRANQEQSNWDVKL